MKESQVTEWKRSWRDEYLKWICGFANADGGVLVIGRDDDGSDVGIDNAEKLLEDIPNKIRDLLGIVVDVNLLEISDNELLQISVEPHSYPISYKGQYHVRSGSTKQELKGSALDNFLLKKLGKHWDGVPIPHVDVSDLASSAITSFKVRASKGQRLSKEALELNDKALLEKLHLFEVDYLKRAAVILFHPDPARFVTGAVVKIGYFRSNSDLAFQDEISGDLFSVVEKTMDLLTTKYLKAQIDYKGIQREEKLPVAEVALREAVLNAVAHKDYASNTPIQISVYRDKLMIWNNGILKEGWTVETLKQKHPSQPFNPDIANTLFLAGMIESWGRGIEKMIMASLDHGSEEPTFSYEDAGVWVTFKWIAPDVKIIYNTENLIEIGLKNHLPKNHQLLLKSMSKNPLATIIELANELKVTRRTVDRYIHQLRDQKLVTRLGNKVSGAWDVAVIFEQDVASNVVSNVVSNVGKDTSTNEEKNTQKNL